MSAGTNQAKSRFAHVGYEPLRLGIAGARAKSDKLAFPN
jgi:hypothetical protein